MAAIKVKIGTLNCHGLRNDKEKRKLIFDLATQIKLDILILQETNLRDQDEENVKRE